MQEVAPLWELYRDQPVKTVKVPLDIHTKLRELTKTMNLPSLGSVIAHETNLVSQKYGDPVDITTAMHGTEPIVITGKPLSGKTYFVKNKILNWIKKQKVMRYNVYVVDTAHEYSILKHVSDDFQFKGDMIRVRFRPDKEVRKAERDIEWIFERLNDKRKYLKKWIVIVEEAHRYQNIQSFLSFVYESRKFARKVILVTPQYSAFLGLNVFDVKGNGIYVKS